MSKKMLINATHLEENRVAIVEDGVLSELDIEIAGREQTKGNIYKAVVVRVETGLQAAFIDYGGERLGFIQMGEIHPSYFRSSEKNGENKGRPRIADVLRRGQELLVQIVKEERGTKGAALTTFLSLPGRYMVLMPESDSKGISRKIEDDSQRKKIKEAMASLALPENMGYIVRTAGIGQSKEELKRDFDYLVRLYQNIQALGKKAKAPALIYKESNLVIRSIRDYFSADMDEVLVDDPKVFDEARDFFQQVMPEYARLVKLHQERRPIFARYQIEEQIETISKNKVPLPSGGSIVIDQTEALVAVDVNSGKMAGESGVESTAFKSNLEAAAEVGRQLRLRDLGGLIVVDFIDMRDRKHIREVEKCLKDALKNDKARVTVGRISQFGLLEMSRQRIKAALAEGAYLPCPHCQGSGKVKSPEAQAVAFMRKIQAGVAKGQIGLVEGEIPLDVATYLLNSKRNELHAMERQYNLAIFIKGHPDFVAGQAEVSFHKREQEQPAPEYVSAADAVVAPEEEAEEVAQAAEAAAEEPAATEGEGKKKRRRRKKKKAAAEEGAPPEAAAEEEAEAAEEPEEAGEEEAAPGEGKKRRRRRRRRKKGGAEAAGEEAAAGEAIAEEAAAEPQAAPTEEARPAAPAEAAAPSEAAGETEAQPKRRRTHKKAEPEPQAAAAEEAQPAAPAETAAPVGEEKAVEPAPAEKAPAKKRAPRKKKEAEKAEPAAEAPPAEVKAVEPAPAEEAPAKKRAPRKKKEAEKAEAPAAEEKAVEPTPTAEAPAKKRAPRRKKEAEKAEAPAAQEKAVEPAPKEEAPAKKRAPRKKKEAEKTEPAAEAPPAEEKPAAKKRAPRKKKAEPETPAE